MEDGYVDQPGKPTRKLPGRTLIRPGTGLSKAEKAAINFPTHIIEVITGQLLGDSCLSLHGNEANLKVGQKDYLLVQSLWDLFDSIGIVGATPHLRIRKGGTNYMHSLRLLYPFSLHSINSGIP
jgi:hypothetical protein